MIINQLKLAFSLPYFFLAAETDAGFVFLGRSSGQKIVSLYADLTNEDF